MSRLLVGRARELAKLETAIRDVGTASLGRVVLLAGEPGIGKSRLADELARLAAGSGLAVVWGRAWEAGAAPPFWPWIQVARALDGPLAKRLGGGGPAASAVGPDRFELFDTCAQELARAASARPLAVILEDLHAADQPSLLLLLFVAQQLRDQPVLLVGTYREAEARLSPERAATLGEVAKLGEVITPAPLRREDVAHLVADSQEGRVEEALVEALHAATEGNPLFVDELLRLLETGGPAALAGSIPDGVRAAIRRHLSLVTEECRSVLGAAAVIGREFDVDAVATALGLDAAAVAAHVGAAARAGLVVDLQARGGADPRRGRRRGARRGAAGGDARADRRFGAAPRARGARLRPRLHVRPRSIASSRPSSRRRSRRSGRARAPSARGSSRGWPVRSSRRPIPRSRSRVRGRRSTWRASSATRRPSPPSSSAPVRRCRTSPTRPRGCR